MWCLTNSNPTYEADRLLADLDDLRDPASCPHGRPVWVVVDRAEIERGFGMR